MLQLSFSPDSTQYILFAEQLVEKPDSKIISFYYQWFVFFAFQDMLIGKISQEEFVALGDSFGKLYEYQHNPVFAKESFVYWLLHHPKDYEHSYILFSKQDKEFLEKSIPLLDIILKNIKSQIIYL